jgi:hypothetical protein
MAQNLFVWWSIGPVNSILILWIMKIWKRNDLYENFEKRGGSRETDTTDTNMTDIFMPYCFLAIYIHFFDWYSIREKVCNSIFIFRAISLTSVGKPPCFLHFLPCLHMALSSALVATCVAPRFLSSHTLPVLDEVIIL